MKAAADTKCAAFGHRTFKGKCLDCGVVVLIARKVYRGTWLARRGASQDFLKMSSAMGPRVVVHTWEDTGEVRVRAVTGDGWRGGPGHNEFKEFGEPLVELRPTPERVDEMVRECAGRLP